MIIMSLGLISRLFSCSPLLLEWMGISTSGTRWIEGPVHSLLKQLQYQAWPLSTGGLRKYALLLGACVPHSAFWPFWAHNPGPFSTLIFAALHIEPFTDSHHRASHAIQQPACVEKLGVKRLCTRSANECIEIPTSVRTEQHSVSVYVCSRGKENKGSSGWWLVMGSHWSAGIVCRHPHFKLLEPVL